MNFCRHLKCYSLILFLLCQNLNAVEFFIDKIEAEGLQRVTYGRLLSVTQLEANQIMTEQDIAKAIKDIFADRKSVV